MKDTARRQTADHSNKSSKERATRLRSLLVQASILAAGCELVSVTMVCNLVNLWCSAHAQTVYIVVPICLLVVASLLTRLRREAMGHHRASKAEMVAASDLSSQTEAATPMTSASAADPTNGQKQMHPNRSPTQIENASAQGYDIQVRNHAEDVVAPYTVLDSGDSICANIVDAASGKLEVAPCFLPTTEAGPYWVIDFNHDKGYALISGGAPKESADGGCRTGTGVNDAGLWIFTRQQNRDEALLQKVRLIAQDKGFDLSVLNDVDNSDCTEQPIKATVVSV